MQLVRGFWDPQMKGGRLAALNKADGGIRPVLSGEVLRRVPNFVACFFCSTARRKRTSSDSE